MKRIIADFHLHSKYSRATSKNMVIDEIAKWAKWKGTNLLGTGDFTHPVWFKHLKENLEPLGNGLLIYKKYPDIKYILTAEIANIYTEGGKVRKIHSVILAPSLESVYEINKRLSKIGNIHSDGRPILGMPVKELAKLVFDVDPKCMLIPAHAWTPWFSVFGSKSGFDNLEECFGELTPQIYAIETGLSSDPEMNWRLSGLDNIALISCSDAHSPQNLGREATVFECDSRDFSYDDIVNAIKNSRNSKNPFSTNSKLIDTLEFFPEEGMYHLDGHRACGNISLHPKESKRLNKICPKCGRPLTIGVLHRVEDLADRNESYKPKDFPGSKHLVPLQEIISEVYNVGKSSKKVQTKYHQIITSIGSEFDVLLYRPLDELKHCLDDKIFEAISLIRENKVQVTPGFDGVYGKVKIFGGKFEKIQKEQPRLF
jgi:uncharacterized protein (TIGR00375 family)